MTAKKEAPNALDLLIDDHKSVRKLFKEYEKIHQKAPAEDKQDLAEQICNEFLMHADLEEQIFYPAVRDAIKDEELINEAEVEHQTARDLIEQIQAMAPDDELYDAKVQVLGEYVEHHVEEEETEMFPKAKKAKLDLDALGQEMLQAKEAARTGFLAAKPKGRKTGRPARH